MTAIWLSLVAFAQPTVGPTGYFESTEPKTIGSGYRFTEGPCWIGDSFVFCDVSGDTVYRWVPGDDSPKPMLTPSGRALGVNYGPDQRIYLAKSGDRAIVRYDRKGDALVNPFVLAKGFDGKDLIDTNDLATDAQGNVYFTDPQFFNRPDPATIGPMSVYQVTAKGVVTRLTDAIVRPNGVAVDPSNRFLIVTEYSSNKLFRIDLKSKAMTLVADLVALTKAAGIEGRGQADGVRFDAKGNVVSTGPGGLCVVNPQGKLIHHLPAPGNSNLAFGGTDGKTLLLTRGTTVGFVRTLVPGAGVTQKVKR